MQSKTLSTPIDELVEIIKNEPNCKLSELKKILNLPLEIIEIWLVVLEEFGVLNVHYKGFEGFIKINENSQDKNLKQSEEEQLNIDNLKNSFVLSSKEKNLSYEKMSILWPKFILEFEDEIKLLFDKKSKEKGYLKSQIDSAWIRYKKELEVF